MIKNLEFLYYFYQNYYFKNHTYYILATFILQQLLHKSNGILISNRIII